MSSNPSLSLNLIEDVRQLTTFPFMVNALEAATIVAVVAAISGWYMVLRRQAFAGHTLSVMAFPGATGAALIGIPISLGYYLACGIAALMIGGTGRARGSSRSAETAAVGAIQAAGLAAGFLFLSLDQQVLGGPETLLFGTFLGVSSSQVLALLAIGAGALIAIALCARPLLLSTLDPEVARASGVPVAALDVVFLLILAAAVATTSQITGALLVFALLLAPPAAAQQITMRPLQSLVLSVVFALLIAWLGLGIAYFSPYPVGFWTTTFAFGLYLLAAGGRRLVRA